MTLLLFVHSAFATDGLLLDRIRNQAAGPRRSRCCQTWRQLAGATNPAGLFLVGGPLRYWTDGVSSGGFGTIAGNNCPSDTPM